MDASRSARLTLRAVCFLLIKWSDKVAFLSLYKLTLGALGTWGMDPHGDLGGRNGEEGNCLGYRR